MMEQRRRQVAAEVARTLPEGARIVWELGCGHGHFLAAYATQHPDQLCLGIDIDTNRIARAERKRERVGLANLHFVRAEARMFLEVLPCATAIERVFVLFPDPWPKLRHHKHRIMRPPFLAELATRATAECRLFFRTDHHPYFEDTIALLQSDPHWQVVAEPWPFEFETVFQARAESYASLVASRRP
jgi:tRNA (guanine-N7-)-methyltransferase